MRVAETSRMSNTLLEAGTSEEKDGIGKKQRTVFQRSRQRAKTAETPQNTTAKYGHTLYVSPNFPT